MMSLLGQTQTQKVCFIYTKTGEEADLLKVKGLKCNHFTEYKVYNNYYSSRYRFFKPGAPAAAAHLVS